MKLPNRIRLSTHATERLKLMKGWTGLTPNILARIAIMIVIRDNVSIDNAGLQDTNGQELSKGVLFGEHSDIYEILLTQYFENSSGNDLSAEEVAKLVEIGVHKLGHVRSLEHIAAV